MRGPLTPRCVSLCLLAAAALLLGLAGAGCGDEGDAAADGSLDVVASATFLADIAQNVAGDRFTVRAMVPPDADLHAYEPTPRDLADVAGADLFLVNGAGLEGTLEDTVRAAAGDVNVVEASAGLESRTPRPGEPAREAADDGAEPETDPHFWLDPTLAQAYVATIRDAFSAADPEGAATYAANAERYVAKLEALDQWIRAQVETIPADQRLLVVNHVSHGYFADRYGFKVVGAVIPSVATGATPTARQLADLTQAIRESGAKAIFVESEENPALAAQIAAETGIAVVDDLRDHSLSGPDGEAPTYIEMMRFDTRRIVAALR
jgi:zinc/manganese transport system substrate-binding protein